MIYIDKEKLWLTSGIVNCRCSAYSSGTARIKSSCNLTGNRLQSATSHTTTR